MIIDDLIGRDARRDIQTRTLLRATEDGSGIGMDDILAVLRQGGHKAALADGGFSVLLDGDKIPRGDARVRARQIALEAATADAAAVWLAFTEIASRNWIESAPVSDAQLETIRARYAGLFAHGANRTIQEAAEDVLQLCADLAAERQAAAGLAAALHTIYETATNALAIPPPEFG
jgi:hypothetical protein